MEKGSFVLCFFSIYGLAFKIEIKVNILYQMKLYSYVFVLSVILYSKYMLLYADG